LLLHLLAVVEEHLGFLPFWWTIEEIHDVSNERGEIIAEVESLRGNTFVILMKEQPASDTELVGSFGEKTHDEDETDHDTDQPSNIREIVVDFVEAAGVCGSCRLFVEDQVHIGEAACCVHVVVSLE
jgi:hypothetical protein